MATTTTGTGTGSGSGTGAPKPTKTANPKFGLEVTSFVDDSNINLRIRTSKDSAPCALNVIIHSNYKQVAQTDTDIIGFLEYKVPYAQTDKKQVFTLEVFMKDSNEKSLLTVEIPEKEKATASKNDPQKIVLIRTHDGAGHFRIFIRVIKAQGYGLPVNVDIIFDGQRYSRKTNDRGIAAFDVPRVIAAGEEFPLQAIVSGIEDHARLKIHRRSPRAGGPALWTRAWFLGTNNGRAFILMCTVAFFWLWSIAIGIGQPFLNQGWFRNDDGFSKQELVYNRVMTDAYTSINAAATEKVKSTETAKPWYKRAWKSVFGDKSIANNKIPTPQIMPTKVPGHWHHLIWKTAVVLTFVLLIYGPLSLREEIAEEFGIVVERLMDREYAQAGDPWFERLVAWSGAYSVARNKANISSSTSSSDSTQASNSAYKETMWSEFPVHLASDALVEFVPAIFRAMMR